MIFFNLFKYSIMLSLAISNFLPLMFFDIMTIWFIMEISNFLFICLMNISLKNKKSIFLYFMTQVLSSMMIIYVISFNMMFNNSLSNTALTMAIMMKLSIPPFHFWLIIVSKFMSWDLLLILLTFQKITPFYMMSILSTNKLIMYGILISCAIIPPYMMLNLKNFKMLFSYSSVNQSGWMVMLILTKSLIWMKYFIFYIFIMMSLFIFLKQFKIFYNSNYSSAHNMSFNLLMIMLMFNLAGMPPMSLFYIKWFSMYMLMKNFFTLIMLIMMMISSMIMLYIYVNMMTSYMFNHKLNSKLLNIDNQTSSLNTMIYLGLFMSLILLII